MASFNYEIERLSQEIVTLEDEIKEIEAQGRSKHSSSRLEEEIKEFSSNKEKIAFLKELIETEKSKCNLEVSAKENEKLVVSQKLDELSKSIGSFRSKGTNKEFSQEQTKHEKNLMTLVRERKEKEKELKESQMRIKVLGEKLSMIREDKHAQNAEILNLISQKESFEEIIHHYTILNQNNLRVSFDNLEKDIRFEFCKYDLQHIKLTQFSTYFTTILNQKLSKLSLSLKNEEAFEILSACFKILLSFDSPSEYFDLLGKRIFEHIFKNKSDLKHLVDVEKLTALVKFAVKCILCDEIMSKKINYVSKELKTIKKEVKDEISSKKFEMRNLLERVQILKDKEKETLFNLENSRTASKSDAQSEKKLIQKKETLEIFLSDLEEEIMKLKENLVTRLNSISSQIDSLRGKNLKMKQNLSQFIPEDETKRLILGKRIQIAENYRKIKQLMAEIGNNDYKERSRLINEYIRKVDEKMNLEKEKSDSFNEGNTLKNEIIKKMERLKQSRDQTNITTINSFSKQVLHSQPNTKLNKNNSLTDIIENPNKAYNNRHQTEYDSSRYNVSAKQRDKVSRREKNSQKDNVRPDSIRNRSRDRSTKRSLRSSQSFEDRSTKSQIQRSKSPINIKDNSLTEIVFKLNISFRIEDCSPFEFDILETLRPLLEGCIVYRRNHMPSKTYQYFDPLNGRDPETYGFEHLFLSLDKTLRLFVFTNEDLLTKTELFIEKIETYQVSKTTHMSESVFKVCSDLEKQFIDPETYFNSLQHGKNSRSILDEEYRKKHLNSQYFLIYIQLKSAAKVEIIFTKFEEYKAWTRGLDCLLKNKSRLSLLRNKIV